MGVTRRKLEAVPDPALVRRESAPKTSMVRECGEHEEREEERRTVAPPEPSATTQLGAWQVVADLLANVQRQVGGVAERVERLRFESELRPLARAVRQWEMVAPHPAQSKIVLERLLEIQDELSEIKTAG